MFETSIVDQDSCLTHLLSQSYLQSGDFERSKVSSREGSSTIIPPLTIKAVIAPILSEVGTDETYLIIAAALFQLQVKPICFKKFYQMKTQNLANTIHRLQ